MPKTLRFYLDEIKTINSEEFVLREAVPFNILVSSLVRTDVECSSEVRHYLDVLKFPKGSNSKQITLRKKETYLPLVNINVSSESISGELDIFTKEVYHLINSEVENLEPCIEIALMEIFNNIRSHSKADKISYLAQRWFDDKLEFAIYDNGVGFKETLKTLNEKEALEKAVFKKQSSTGDINRGWGIQTLKVLVLNEEIKGEFLLISNDTYCYINKEEDKVHKEIDKIDFNIKGSMIILRLNNLTTTNFEKIRDFMLVPDEFVVQNNLLD